jgi:hypothetical protein
MIDPNMTSRLQFIRRRWLPVAYTRMLMAVAALLTPGVALAQDEAVKNDARLEGYATKVTVDSDSTALSWLLLVFLAMVALGVMFKNAKRTHLD